MNDSGRTRSSALDADAAAASAAAIRSEPSRPSPRSTQAQPKPVAIRRPSAGSWTAVHASAASMLARSSRQIRRCRACSGPRSPAAASVATAASQSACAREGDVVEGGVAEPVERERPDAVEQPVARRATFDGELDRDQRAVGETTDDVGRRLRRHVERRQHVLDPGERCAVGEAAERPETALIVGEQQVVAPRDRRLERTLPIGSAARRVTQQGEPVVQSSTDLVDRHRPRPCRGELDRQRESVERSTHRLDGRPRRPPA